MKTSYQTKNKKILTTTQTGHYACVQLLVEAGARVNVKCNEGHSAEQIAQLNGHQGVYDYLKLSRESKSHTTMISEEIGESESETESITAISNSQPIQARGPS